MSVMSDFDIDRAMNLREVESGVFEVEVSKEWDTPNQTPNGGYILGLVLKAAQLASPKPDALSASVTYLKPTAPSLARIETEVLRSGRTVASVEARMIVNGQATTHLVATFIDRSASPDINHPGPRLEPLAAPEDCIDVFAQMPDGLFPIAEHFSYRHPSVPSWVVGEPSGEMRADYWMKPIDDRPYDDVALGIMVDAYPPVTAEINQIASATVHLTVHFRQTPEPGWLRFVTRTHHVLNGFHEEDVEVYDSAGKLVAQSRQIAILS